MQTKRDSVREVLTNTFIGMVGSYVITYVTFRTVNNVEGASAITVALCTIWSIARGYVIRRRFDKG